MSRAKLKQFNGNWRQKTPTRSTIPDERLIFLAILRIHKDKDVDIDSVVTKR